MPINLLFFTFRKKKSYFNIIKNIIKTYHTKTVSYSILFNVIGKFAVKFYSSLRIVINNT